MDYRFSLFIISFLFISLLTTADNQKRAYKLFTAEGETTSYQSMLKAVQKADVLFIGEQHNNPISHWMQLELTQDLYEENQQDLVLGAEMFEADDQLILNEYLNGWYSEKKLKKEAKLWPNYETDYAPLLHFAKDKGLPFIATNVPRRYANIVYKKGIDTLDSLDTRAHQYMAPLPIEVNMELKSYQQMKKMAGQHGNPNLPAAQALKDATMAHFIDQNREKGQYFIHYNGAYHSDHKEGIVWYLQQLNPDIKVCTITTVQQSDITKLEEIHHGKADYIICVPEGMTKTH